MGCERRPQELLDPGEGRKHQYVLGQNLNAGMAVKIQMKDSFILKGFFLINSWWYILLKPTIKIQIMDEIVCFSLQAEINPLSHQDLSKH